MRPAGCNAFVDMPRIAERRAVEPPRGLTFVEELLTPVEEAALLAAFAGLAFAEIRMHGVVAKRTAIHYGWDYGYDSWQVAPGPPIPPLLEPLRRRCAALAGVPPEQLEAALVNRYPPGAGIGWHRDAPMFGVPVVGVSLGGACVMRFRRTVGGERELWLQPLPPRSAYVLDGAARWTWQHSIRPLAVERFSVTFRTLKR